RAQFYAGSPVSKTAPSTTPPPISPHGRRGSVIIASSSSTRPRKRNERANYILNIKTYPGIIYISWGVAALWADPHVPHIGTLGVTALPRYRNVNSECQADSWSGRLRGHTIRG